VRFLARTTSRLRGRAPRSTPVVPEVVPEPAAEATAEPVDAPVDAPAPDAEEVPEAEAEDEIEIVAVDPTTLALGAAGRLAALDRTEMVSSGRDLAAISGRALHATAHHGCAGLWVAGSLAQPLGWAMLSEHGDDVVLHGDVAHHQRHQGVGGLLLGQALEQARLDGHDAVLATTWEGSGAERFLRRHGFVGTGRPARAVRRLELVAIATRLSRVSFGGSPRKPSLPPSSISTRAGLFCSSAAGSRANPPLVVSPVTLALITSCG